MLTDKVMYTVDIQINLHKNFQTFLNRKMLVRTEKVNNSIDTHRSEESSQRNQMSIFNAQNVDL